MNINLTLIIQAVAYAAFIWICARFIWPPLMRAIETRQKQIADGLAAGDQGRKELANAQKREAEIIAEAKAKSTEIVAMGEKYKADAIEQAKVDAKVGTFIEANSSPSIHIGPATIEAIPNKIGSFSNFLARSAAWLTSNSVTVQSSGTTVIT